MLGQLRFPNGDWNRLFSVGAWGGLLVTVLYSSWLFSQIISLGLVQSLPAGFAQDTQSVGVTVAVPVNSYNLVAKQLKEKAESLRTQQQLVEAKEIWIREQARQQRLLLVFTVSGGVVLLFLLGFNFYLDYNYRQRRRYHAA